MQESFHNLSFYLREELLLQYLTNLWNAVEFGSLRDILLRVAAVFLCLTIHETCHGLAAYALGDPTAKRAHRLSLNPLRHIDWLGLIMMVVAGFGWAKPVPVRMDRLDNPRFGMMAVGAAGPGVNIALALVGALSLGLIVRFMAGTADAMPELVVQALITFMGINVFLALFNLLPIPPFDGSHIVQGLLPERLGEAYGRLQRYGMVVFALLIAVTWLAPQLGIVERLVGGPFDWVMRQLLAFTGTIAGQ